MNSNNIKLEDIIILLINIPFIFLADCGPRIEMLSTGIILFYMCILAINRFSKDDRVYFWWKNICYYLTIVIFAYYILYHNYYAMPELKTIENNLIIS